MTNQEMKALGHVAVQAWNEGRPDLLDQVYAPTYRNHFNGETLDMLKQNVLATRAAFSGFTLTIVDEWARGDDVGLLRQLGVLL